MIHKCRRVRCHAAFLLVTVAFVTRAAAQPPSYVPLTITTASLQAGTAGAGYSQTVNASGGLVGEFLHYTWSVASGSLPAGLSLDSSTGTIAGLPTAAGTSNFTIQVNDLISSTRKALAITINPPLSVTTASLPASTAGVGYSQALNASGGTPPYTWSVSAGSLAAGLSLNSSSGTISGTPTAAATSNFTVKVKDSATATATKALAVTINPPPSVTTVSLPASTAGVSYSQALNASGGTPPYTWSVSGGSLPSGLSLNSSSGTVSGTPTAASTSNFTVQVKDSVTATATKALAVTINPPPSVTTASLPASTAGVGYSQALNASGGTPPYTWSVSGGSLPSGLSLNSSSGTVSGTPTAAATSNFTVQVKDSASASAAKALTITINPPPSVTTASLPAGTAGVAYSQALNASGGTPPYTWSISGGSLPAGFSLDSSSGSINGTPATATTANFTVQVKDSATATATKALTITIVAPLSITVASLPGGTVGIAYSQPLNASGGVSPYTWAVSAGALPAGLSLDSSTGAIGGTATTAGSSNFTIEVRDSAVAPATATKALVIIINPAPLSITTASLPGGTVGVAYSQPLNASGGVSPYTWSVSAGSLPAGLSLNSSTGVIGGPPTAAGSSNFTVQVKDSASANAAKALTITINPPALSITTASLPGATVGVAYSQTLNASGGTPPYTWSVAAGSLPAGLALAASGAFAGTPAALGNANFTVQVKDSAAAVSAKSFSMSVNPAPIAIGPEILPGGTAGASYSQVLSATGGSAPYSWSVATGALPSGIALDAGTGALSGTPSAAGSFAFVVQVSDRTSSQGTKQFTILITPTLKITTDSTLSSGVVTTAYSQDLRATGGTPPYTWSVTGATLPPGLTLSPGGRIAGTPSTSGTFTFGVLVADSALASATAQFTITIGAGLTIPTAPVLPDGVIGKPYSQKLAVAGGSPPYVWSVSGGSLAGGLALNSGTGDLSGTPGATGTFQFTVQLTDGASTHVEKQFKLTITPAPTITTALTLPGGRVGVFYSQSLAATGGTPPYGWSVVTGALPAGLTLDAVSGALSGTPAETGDFNFTAEVTDSSSNTVDKVFSLSITPGLVITTGPALPDGAAGTGYSQVLTAAGGKPPYVWSILTGSLPTGLSLSADGKISGTPTVSDVFTFVVQVADSSSATTSKQMTIVTGSDLIITTDSPLASGMAGTAYSQALSASGGKPPYLWSVVAGALPTGLSLDSRSGVISGAPTVGGDFNLTIQVSDGSHASAARDYILSLSLPPLPNLSVDGLPDTAGPAQQMGFELSFDTGYPAPVAGVVTLTFVPDAVNPSDDPAIQFSTGGRSAAFTIAANETHATFPLPRLALATGTVAGVIQLSVEFQASGSNGFPNGRFSRSIRIARSAPSIVSVTTVRNGQSFEVRVTAFSTSRALTEATIHFVPTGGSDLRTTTLTVPLSEVSTRWYRSPNSAQFGSQFVLVLPFTIQGNLNSIQSIGVELKNDEGSSLTSTTNF